MKYANIVFEGKEICNLGDQMQIIALNNLYRRFGISENDIVRIPFSQLDTFFSNEKVVLPISFPILKYSPNGIPSLFSKCIEPVFIGFTWPNDFFSQNEISFLKKYQPIGCRDEYTKNNLQKNGIQAYLNGCITLTAFFDNPQPVKRKTIYIVDVDEWFIEKIPDCLKNDAVFTSQYVKCQKGKSNYQEAIDRYNEYYSNARLVITSRLHCAIPCLSMGIPVILLRKKISYRFSWVERLINIYTVDNFDTIDWNPTPVDCYKIIDLQINNFYNVVFKHNNELNGLIDKVLSNRTKNKYFVEGVDPAKEYLASNLFDGPINYIIWGATIASKVIYDYISKNYPNFKLISFIDKYASLKMGDILSQPLESIENSAFLSSVVFVTATAVNQEAKTFFDSIGKKDRIIYCYPTFFKTN